MNSAGTVFRSRISLVGVFFHAFVLFFAAYAVRTFFFSSYLVPKQGFLQPDSPDYHVGALGLASGIGLRRVDTYDHVFWRTPGYSLFMAAHYLPLKAARIWDMQYYQNEHKAVIKTQLWWSSLIPMLFFLCMLAFSGSWGISLVAGWFSVMHVGYVAAAGFLLSDSLALIPWLLWALFFFCGFGSSGWSRSFYVALSAFFFAAYTWMRPQGFWLMPFCVLVLLLEIVPWQEKFARCASFFLLFALFVSPWLVRNYRITGKLFYCPMSGPILQVFVAPKILRRITNEPLQKCWEHMINIVGNAQQQIRAEYYQKTGGKVLPREFVSFQFAWPIVRSYLGMMAYDWLIQCFKTAFDLYSYQLVAIEKQIHFWDPLEEHLSEKVYDVLLNSETPLWIRLLGWTELLYLTWLWVTVICAALISLYKLFTHFLRKERLLRPQELYIYTVIFVLVFLSALVIGMTGGFGYARLRMPVELLMLAAAFLFWHNYFVARFLHSKHNTLLPIGL